MDPPWFKEYEEFGIPKTLKPYPKEPVHNFLDKAAEEHGDMGLVQPGVEMKYPEVKEQADRLATALRERGVEKGDRVATILPTSIQFIVSDYAISKAGGVNIPNDFLESQKNLKYRLKSGNPKVLIGIDQQRKLIMSLKETLKIENLILTKLDDYTESPPEKEELNDGEWLTNILEETPPDPPELNLNTEEDLKVLMFTGGTTGLPKGCMLTHKNVVANALQNAVSQSHLADMLRGSSYILNSLPLYHAYGYSVMHTIVHLAAGQLLVPDPRDTNSMVKMIKEHNALVQVGVPTQFMKMVKEELEDVNIIGMSGSAPLASKTKEEFSRKTRGLAQGYGLSEMSPVTHFDTRAIYEAMTGQAREGGLGMPTIGTPLPDTEVKVANIDTGKRLSWEELIEKGKEGEMCLKGPQRMIGYWNKDERGFDDEGYVHTGDVVKMDENGRFYIVDRVKDMINVSGLKVYSEEVDEILHNHPAVARAATIGIPDPERPGSERVKLYIELDNDYESEVDEEEFIEYLRGKVAKYAIPKAVEFIDEMPLTPIGKVDKKFLRGKEKQK